MLTQIDLVRIELILQTYNIMWQNTYMFFLSLGEGGYSWCFLVPHFAYNDFWRSKSARRLRISQSFKYIAIIPLSTNYCFWQTFTGIAPTILPTGQHYRASGQHYWLCKGLAKTMDPIPVRRNVLPEILLITHWISLITHFKFLLLGTHNHWYRSVYPLWQ